MVSRVVSFVAVAACAAFVGCGSTGKSHLSPENRDLETDDEEILYPAGLAEQQPGPTSNVDLEVVRGARLNTETWALTVPVKAINNRDRTVLFVLNRAEVEQTDGVRRKRYQATGVNKAVGGAMGRDDQALVPPGGSKTFTVVFGNRDAKLRGDSFRVYLHAVQTDGSGALGNLPVIILGNGTFAKPPRPFMPEQTPAPAAVAPGSAPAPVATKACGACGASMPTGLVPCPECGSR
jgi:hypothetical protein